MWWRERERREEEKRERTTWGLAGQLFRGLFSKVGKGIWKYSTRPVHSLDPSELIPDWSLGLCSGKGISNQGMAVIKGRTFFLFKFADFLSEMTLPSVHFFQGALLVFQAFPGLVTANSGAGRARDPKVWTSLPKTPFGCSSLWGRTWEGSPNLQW